MRKLFEPKSEPDRAHFLLRLERTLADSLTRIAQEQSKAVGHPVSRNDLICLFLTRMAAAYEAGEESAPLGPVSGDLRPPKGRARKPL